MSALQFISSFSTFVPLATIIAVKILLRREFRFPDKPFIVYITGCAVVEFTNFILYFLYVERLWLIHLFTIFEVAVLTFQLVKWAEDKYVALLVSSAATLFALYILIFYQDLNNFEFFNVVFEHSLLTTLACWAFYKTVQFKGSNTFTHHRIYLIIGVLWYFAAGSSYVMIAFESHIGFVLHLWMNLTANLIYAIGLATYFLNEDRIRRYYAEQ